MQLLHPRRHRSLEARDGSLAREKAALELELDLFALLVDCGADDEESVRGSQRLVSR